MIAAPSPAYPPSRWAAIDSVGEVPATRQQSPDDEHKEQGQVWTQALSLPGKNC